MFEMLCTLLADQKGGIVFKCFGPFHLGVIFLFAIVAVVACLFIKKHPHRTQKIIHGFINTAFTLYILDFFLMPFAYGEIDVEKLPFHVCTAMCVLCFLSAHNTVFEPFKTQLAMLGFLSNLIYLIYPAGVMWQAVHPLSYRVIQTLSFHGIMMVYGLLVLVTEYKNGVRSAYRKDLLVIACMTAWACLGNTLYNSSEKVYNWFFVVQDPFYILPPNIAPYGMPFLNIALFFSVEMGIYFLLSKVLKQRKELAPAQSYNG